jgi:hypothetical protein
MMFRAARPSACRYPIACVLAAVSLVATGSITAAGQGVSGAASRVDAADPAANCNDAQLGSPYIPVDSWIYPAVSRLYSMGYLDHIYLGMRPWTWLSLDHMLEATPEKIEDAQAGPVADEAARIYDALHRELQHRMDSLCSDRRGAAQVDSTYTTVRAISGTPLRDSFHLGSTIVNDYGRPFENGVNNYTGASGYAVAGRFTLYARGEFQGAPSAAGYSPAVYQALATVDGTVNPVTGAAYGNQATIPEGPIGTAAQGRFLEAYVSAQVLNHVISFGKQDEWLGPAAGASMAYSNNAENIYALHINRIEPLYIPFLSRFTGPFRYEFLVGPLRGHTLMPNPLYANNPTVEANVVSPGDPWTHVEKISFRPTANLEFGFERTALFGGEGHSPVTLHTFLKSFFSLSAPDAADKDDRNDPGARFGAFDFSYRLPFVRNWLTLYSDSEVHDDLSPIDAPRRAAIRPGLYLSHLPGVPRLDLRAEAALTDPRVASSQGGRFMYWEVIERQGYTNQGQLFGDWIGREDKGGQAWATYHLSGNEWVQASWRHQKAARDFIPGGTTLNDVDFQAVKRVARDFEIQGSFALEHWKAPVYLPGEQTVTTTSIQFTWQPKRSAGF